MRSTAWLPLRRGWTCSCEAGGGEGEAEEGTATVTQLSSLIILRWRCTLSCDVDVGAAPSCVGSGGGCYPPRLTIAGGD